MMTIEKYIQSTGMEERENVLISQAIRSAILTIPDLPDYIDPFSSICWFETRFIIDCLYAARQYLALELQAIENAPSPKHNVWLVQEKFDVKDCVLRVIREYKETGVPQSMNVDIHKAIDAVCEFKDSFITNCRRDRLQQNRDFAHDLFNIACHASWSAQDWDTNQIQASVLQAISMSDEDLTCINRAVIQNYTRKIMKNSKKG